VFDAGFNYNNYVLEGGKYVPAEGAGIVFSRQGKAALFLLKQVTSTNVDTIDSIVKLVNKTINSNQPQLSTQAKFVSKPILDLINELVETVAKSIFKSINSNQPQLSTQVKDVSKPILDTQAQLSLPAKLVSKPVDEIIQTADDNTKHYFKNTTELQELIEVSTNNIVKPLLESQLSSDSNNKEAIKILQSILTDYVSTATKSIVKNIEEVQSLEEILSKNTQKQVNLTIDAVSQIFKGYEIRTVDSASGSSFASNNLMKNFALSSGAETTSINTLRTKNILEEIQILINKPIFEISKLHREFLEAISFNNKLYGKTIVESPISTLDIIELARLVEFFSNVQALFTGVKSVTKAHVELQNLNDAMNKLLNKLPRDAINTSMNGRIKLSSEVYDSEDYYEVFQDYQTLTKLS
jgi:hypothetical protein